MQVLSECFTGNGFSATQGYQAVWGVCAVAMLLSLWPLRRLRAHAPEG